MPMPRQTRSPLAWLSLIPLGLLLIALFYMVGMGWLEGEPRDFWQSLAWAGETLTTTGYGHDDEWRHPVMILFVVAAQLLGVFLLFLLFPVFLIPFFERRFEARLPRAIPTRLRDHVLIYRHGPAVTSLIDDTERQGIPAVILEEDESLARRLRDAGRTVVFTELEDERALIDALRNARALVVNGEDHDNAVVVLGARQGGFQGPIYAFIENPLHRHPILLAGANAAWSPKHALAAALAAQASSRISPRLAGLQRLGERLEVAELRIRRESPVAELTLGEAAVRQKTGATIIGLWREGALVTELAPETRLHPGTLLVAVGTGESIERLGRLATPLARSGPILVAGYGAVGRKVVDMLGDAGEKTCVLDRQSDEGVDLVADALDPQALVRAGVQEARAVILALSSDSTNLFAATIVRDIAPDVALIARVNQAENAQRLRAVGADFVLSIGEVAGQLLGRQLFGEEFITLERAIRLTRVAAAGLEGLNPISARIRERTGCSVVAVGRGPELFAEFEPTFEIQGGDALYLCGAPEAIARYFELYPDARPAAAS